MTLKLKEQPKIGGGIVRFGSLQSLQPASPMTIQRQVPKVEVILSEQRS